MTDTFDTAAENLADAFFDGNTKDFASVAVNRQQLVDLLKNAAKLGRDEPTFNEDILPDPNPLVVVSMDESTTQYVGRLKSLRFRETGVMPGDIERTFTLVVGGEPNQSSVAVESNAHVDPIDPRLAEPEPALEAALLQDAHKKTHPRAVLTEYLDRFEETLGWFDIEQILAAVDRYVDSLPQAEVEYASTPLMDGLRVEALAHAVSIAKVATNLGNMEATDTAGIVEQAGQFHNFLTGTASNHDDRPAAGTVGFAEDDDIERHAEKQGCGWSDAWRYFEREGYDMSHASHQYKDLI